MEMERVGVRVMCARVVGVTGECALDDVTDGDAPQRNHHHIESVRSRNPKFRASNLSLPRGFLLRWPLNHYGYNGRSVEDLYVTGCFLLLLRKVYSLDISR